jgi:hypothetical protein
VLSLSHETDYLQQRENTMTKLKKVPYKTKSCTVGAFVLLSGLLVTLFAAVVLLILPDCKLFFKITAESGR